MDCVNTHQPFRTGLLCEQANQRGNTSKAIKKKYDARDLPLCPLNFSFYVLFFLITFCVCCLFVEHFQQVTPQSDVPGELSIQKQTSNKVEADLTPTLSSLSLDKQGVIRRNSDLACYSCEMPQPSNVSRQNLELEYGPNDFGGAKEEIMLRLGWVN